MIEESKFVSWHDFSLGLWSIIALSGVGILKFLSWFSTREIKSFWEKIDKLQTIKIESLKAEIDSKFSSLDEKVSKIAKATHGRKETKETVLLEVLDQLKRINPKND